ncbi:hypothetical protein ISS03_03130 [Patescibacteria group bacterium]|nr:hypothetical protein [Patescibacteria group bacterium]
MKFIVVAVLACIVFLILNSLVFGGEVSRLSFEAKRAGEELVVNADFGLANIKTFEVMTGDEHYMLVGFKDRIVTSLTHTFEKAQKVEEASVLKNKEVIIFELNDGVLSVYVRNAVRPFETISLRTPDAFIQCRIGQINFAITLTNE